MNTRREMRAVRDEVSIGKVLTDQIGIAGTDAVFRRRY